jgi:hypothetical protein
MEALTLSGIEAARRILSADRPDLAALEEAIGGRTTAGGIWRFFSSAHPASGAAAWRNELRTAWRSESLASQAFGEDLFGNQLVWHSAGGAMSVWDHEDGSYWDAEMAVADMLEGVLSHGLGWVDFYPAGAVDLAQALADQVSWAQHLHWVHPLVLSGAVTRENLALLDRTPHIRGHAELWAQVSGLPAGTELKRT